MLRIREKLVSSQSGLAIWPFARNLDAGFIYKGLGFSLKTGASHWEVSRNLTNDGKLNGKEHGQLNGNWVETGDYGI